MLKPVEVRNGRADDGDAFVRMMLASGDVFAAVWGRRHEALLRHLLGVPGTLYSADLTLLAETEKAVAGMLLGYTARETAERATATRRAVRRFLGLRYYPCVARLSIVHRALPAVADDEYLVAHVAVEPAFRGHGVGGELVCIAAGRARRSDCRRVVLDVRENNLVAIGFYEKLGFSVTSPPTAFHLGSERFAFLRMALPLD
jgi:ribosomal protein S18 acetylase RimI-like enzyme